MGETREAAGGGWSSEGPPSGISSCSDVWELNPYSCHGCRSICLTEILDSDWRLVTLCRSCHFGVKSAKVCSYCFSIFRKLETGLLKCRMCSRRVHRTCIPLHHRNLSSSQLNAFTFFCVDCCPIPKFRGGNLRNTGDSVSRSVFRISLDLTRKEQSIEAKKLKDQIKLRGNTAEKSMVVRGHMAEKAMVATVAAGPARNTLGAVHLVQKPTYSNFSIPDQELALRLHRAMNGSQRIYRRSCPKGTSRLSMQNKVLESTYSAREAIDDRCSDHSGQVDVCLENKSLMEKSESFLSTGLFLQQENMDLMKQIGRSNSDCLVDFSLKEKQFSLQQFRESAGDSFNMGSTMLPLESSDNCSNSSISLTNCRFDHENVLSEIQQKGIDLRDQHRYFRKYFRRRSSGMIMLGQ